jgi:DNA-binding NarL/FixJ family response regulator
MGRILLGGPELLVLDGLRSILEKEFSEIEVAGDLKEFLGLLRSGIFNVAVFDTNWSDWFEQRVRNLIKEIHPNLKSIALVSANQFVPAASSGADPGSWVMKSRPGAALIEMVSSALESMPADEFEIKFEMGLRSPDRHEAPGTFEQLTPRQQQILDLVATGKTLKTIATSLNISVRTVEFHKYKLMKILKVSTTAELVRMAVTTQNGTRRQVEPMKSLGMGSS